MARPRRYYERWVTWWIYVVFYLVHTAAGVILAVWAFVTGHWIVGAVVAAWTLWWTVRLFDELGLGRFVGVKTHNR